MQKTKPNFPDILGKKCLRWYEMLGKSREKMKREGRGALDGALESSALFRDCARRRGRLRIPGPTAYVLGKVLKTGDRHEAGHLVCFCAVDAYESKLSTHHRTKTNQGLACKSLIFNTL
jgi:hypothetical protein